MAISVSASVVSMPETRRPYPTLLNFLVGRFPHVPAEIWKNRIMTGKVFAEEGTPVTLDTAYMPNKRLFYFREVEEEATVPFQQRILFSNDHLMVVCKPHFLPVSPCGPYVGETVINRLKKKTGNPFLSPIHRIDRGTAGVVLLSSNRESRGIYQRMFMEGRVRKTYEAVTSFSRKSMHTEWLVENRLEQGEPWFRMKNCAGTVNARSRIRLVEVTGSRARFLLYPMTGKKHQLRIHLSGLGFPIVNDRYYPVLMPKKPEDFSSPLLLLSRKIEFRDPITNSEMTFESQRCLDISEGMHV